MTAKRVTVFEFKDPKDILFCLEDMVDRYSKELDCKPMAALTAVLAWSLAEWVYKKHKDKLGFNSQNDFQESIRSSEPVFVLLQGLGNAFKHGGEVDHPTRIVGVAEERYFEEGYVEDGYVGNELYIEDDSGHKINCVDALRRALKYWQDFFRDNGI
jgi:hypothetical protein